MKANWSKRTLHFKQPSSTSRGVMKTRDVWFVTLSQDGRTGIGECAPLPGLSLDGFDQIEAKLNSVCQNLDHYLNDLSQLSNFPSIRFGLEMAQLDWLNGGEQKYFSDFHAIEINGLIWMGEVEYMVSQLEEKISNGWKCIKMKIGAIDFYKELEILKSIRSIFDKEELELRVDANGAFSEEDVIKKLGYLSEFDLHSIEQPIQSGQWELISRLCKASIVPIALDEELIPLINKDDRIEMLEKVNPQYLVIKPSLLGGFQESEKWIQLAIERNVGWWVTSALESNIGLNAIAQWTAKVQPNGYQGLGTGELFANNIPSSVKVNRGILSSNHSSIWNDVNKLISEWLNGCEFMTLQTSGSTGPPNSVQFKKALMRNSTKLTSKKFELNEGDSVLLCMPMKYVAGKMMVIRALELGLDIRVVEPSITPLDGVDGPIDFAAMVPLQLENSIDQLDKVKTLIVGGGHVYPSLVRKLQSIKTEVYETYGMTETLTHVAVKPLNGPKKSKLFHALEGIHFELDERGCLMIRAPMLNPELVITNDFVKLISETSFHWLGRIDNVINSGGVKVIPEEVEAKLAYILGGCRFFIAGLPEKSLGEKVILVVEGNEIEISLDNLDKYERPKEVYFIPEFAETVSGKVHRKKTLSLL